MEAIFINTQSGYAVWYDGQTVFENRVETRIEAGEHSRWTGRFGWETNPVERRVNVIGNAIVPEDIPDQVMTYIQGQWQEHQESLAQERARAEQIRQEEAAQQERQNHASEQITIGGVTQPRWSWREGWSIPNAPTDEDMAIICENGWECEQQSNGFWYIIDPRAAAFME